MPAPNENRTPSDKDTERGEKRKAFSLTDNAPLAGRGIRRLVSLFVPISNIVYEFDRRNELTALGLSDEEVDSTDPVAVAAQKERDRNFNSFKELHKLIPDLLETVQAEGQTKSKLKSFYRQLYDGASDALSTDVSRIKSSVADWLNKRKINPAVPQLERETRDGRGIQHDTTGRLLCTISLDWDNPIVRAKVKSFEDEDHYYGKDYYARCLYLGENGDPKNIRAGFLKSALLVKTYKSIFTSPSSARGDLDEACEPEPRKKKSKNSIPHRADVASTLNMEHQVTPRSVAYVAAQSASHWRRIYDDFNYEEFYNFIVDYFEADTSPNTRKETRALLDWWNDQAFPDAAPSRAKQPGRGGAAASMRLLMEQREADPIEE